jgi:hypothetical protein
LRVVTNNLREKRVSPVGAEVRFTHPHSTVKQRPVVRIPARLILFAAEIDFVLRSLCTVKSFYTAMN